MSEEPYVSGEPNSEAAAPVVTDQSESIPAGSQENTQVPLDALQAERAERQKLQDEVRMMKDHLSLMQSSQQQPQQQEKDALDSLSDDDVLTVGEAKKFISKLNNQYETNIKELKVTQKYPDYQNIVTKYLPEVLKLNPGLRDTLQKSQDYELAYYLASNSEAYKADHKRAKKNVDAERIVQNANRAGSLSSVGQTSPISEAKRYREMSDDDFQKQVKKNLGYF